MDTISKQEFRVRDLPTRSVTLFPTRAQVVRDLKDVSLKPGVNQIAIVGLSPTVDDSSIKVEGTGSAIISDIAVELLPNREIFQEIYPETDEEDKSDSDDDDDDEDEQETSPELKEVRRKIRQLRDEDKQAAETVHSAESRLKILDAYGKMLDRKRGVEIDDGIEKYRSERAKVFQDHLDGTIKSRELLEQIKELSKEETRLVKVEMKAAAKAARAKARVRKAKDKEKQKQARRDEEKRKEKRRIHKEHERYWAKQCYTVRITLDAPSFTPSSSRRTSIASVTELAKPVAPLPEKQGAADGTAVAEGDGAVANGPTCDLSISYVTSAAFWAPTYDLQLSTTTNTGVLCFDAQLTNTTSEAWTNCKVTLSTSQTTFSGLSDAIPTLLPWRVKLAKGRGYDGILNSREELAHQNGWRAQQNAWATNQKPRDELFGLAPAHHEARPLGGAGGSIKSKELAVKAAYDNPYPAFGMQQMQQQMAQAPAPRAAGGLFGQAASSSVFATAVAPPPPPAAIAYGHQSDSRSRAPGGRGLGKGGAVRHRKIIHESASASDEEQDGGYGLFDGDADDGAGTLRPEPTPELEFQESSFEETGLTTTYDLPGLKTLTPSSTSSKQRVARISFQNVVFSHTIVAKYKPAAYLKAKLKNASKLTLLKGPAGLTLDGSFMGRTTLPRCSAGDTFSLSLGVDPAIRVAYPKPDVKRATTGIFTKEDSSAYKRSVTIANTRATAGKVATLLVLDQVPVSEDEKLRVELQQPRGLAVGGPSVPAGVGSLATGGGAVTAAPAKDWGTATATLKKGGEIVWDVKLNAGRSVKLDLEYDVSAPTGEGVVQC